MRLYVESNFVLEIALGQEQSAAAQALLRLAEEGKLEIVYPVQAVSEPLSNIGYHAAERRNLRRELKLFSEQLARSRHKAQSGVVETLTELAQRMQILDDAETQQLRAVMRQLLRWGRQLRFDEETFDLGENEHLRSLNLMRRLKLPDAFIFAAILLDLRRSPATSVFVTRDEGFSVLKPDLAALDCSLITNFEHALKRIQAELPQE